MILWSFFLLFSYVNGDTTMEGVVPLDDTTFNKVICHHDACVVLFQQKYAYGEKQKEFQSFAKRLSKNQNILVAELGTSDWGKTENHDTRKQFGIAISEYPVVLLFKKSGNRNPIKYTGNFQENDLIDWIEKETDIIGDGMRSIDRIKILAKQFMTAISSNRDNTFLQELLLTVENELNRLDKNVTLEEELYLSVMKKVFLKGSLYLTMEINRIKGLIKQKLSDDKKLKFQKKLGVLKVFQKHLDRKKEEL